MHCCTFDSTKQARMKHSLLLSSLAVACIAGTASAQIPNGGFENWVTPAGTTYQDPTGWVTFNNLTSLGGASASCEQGSPGAVGAHYATVTTRSTTFGAIPGIISVGSSTGNTGFAYTSRPGSLTGQWQYGIQAGDSGMVVVALTKWDPTGDSARVVGGAVAIATGTLSGWHAINSAFVYQTTETPDSAFVLVASSIGTAVVNSFIKVDDLGFSGSSTGIAEAEASTLQVYPSPVKDCLNLSSGVAMGGLTVVDVTGRTVMQQAANGTNAVMNVDALQHGRYLVVVHMADGKQYVRSFVKE